MGIVFGLLSALCWGISDFLARFAGRRSSPIQALLYMQPFGLALLTVYLLFIQQPRSLEWWAVLLAAGLGITNCLASLCLYRAISVGALSIVSPIASSYGAITLALGLATGERPDLIELFGLIITLAGVILASTQPGEGPKDTGKRGVGLAVAAALFFGVTFWALKYVTPVTGSTLPVWEARLVSMLFLPAISVPLKQSVAIPSRAAWPWIIAIGVLDTCAFVAFTTGLASADSGVVAVLSSLFSAITVLLAWIFLRERLATKQWAGVAGILLGVGMVSAG